jgi:hypothetical protein
MPIQINIKIKNKYEYKKNEVGFQKKERKETSIN